jgi:secondary thiamine-phosphate synthase enzyme
MAVTEIIDVRTTTRAETIDITSLVRAAVKRSGIDDGIAVVFCKHTTAGLTIQENNDPAVKAALLAHLAQAVPHGARRSAPRPTPTPT